MRYALKTQLSQKTHVKLSIPRKPYLSFQMVSLPMTFSDYYTPHLKVTIVFKRFHYQRPVVTPDVDVMITLENLYL